MIKQQKSLNLYITEKISFVKLVCETQKIEMLFSILISSILKKTPHRKLKTLSALNGTPNGHRKRSNPLQ